jgi:hypothetical protein
MTDFRKIIRNRLKLKNKTVRWLVTHPKRPAATNTLYRYLRGEHDLGADRVACILDLIKKSRK